MRCDVNTLSLQGKKEVVVVGTSLAVTGTEYRSQKYEVRERLFSLGVGR
jgi:hypothetical protein